MKPTILIQIPVFLFFFSQAAHAQNQPKKDTLKKDRRGYSGGQDTSGKMNNRSDTGRTNKNYNYPNGNDTGRTKNLSNQNVNYNKNKNDTSGTMKNKNPSQNTYQQGQKTKKDTTYKKQENNPKKGTYNQKNKKTGRDSTR